jgi:hypothetical protein
MSNTSYENLHKLVDYLIKHDIMEAEKLAKILGLELTQFIKEFLEK